MSWRDWFRLGYDDPDPIVVAFTEIHKSFTSMIKVMESHLQYSKKLEDRIQKLEEWKKKHWSHIS